jgi:hypothetical protein
MKLAQCADALHIARRCRIGASNFTWIEVKIGHSALQEMRRIRTAFRRGAQLGGRHGNIPRHPLHVGFPAECKIRSVSCLYAISTPLQHGCKWAVFSMGQSKHVTPFLEAAGVRDVLPQRQYNSPNFPSFDLGQPRAAGVRIQNLDQDQFVSGEPGYEGSVLIVCKVNRHG